MGMHPDLRSLRFHFLALVGGSVAAPLLSGRDASWGSEDDRSHYVSKRNYCTHGDREAAL